MKDAVRLGFWIVGAAGLMSVFALAFAAHYRSSIVVRLNWSRRGDWRFYVWLFLAFLGLSVMTFMGTKGILGWIPESWGTTSEDGEWNSIRDTASSIIAATGGFGGISILLEYARQRYTGPQNGYMIKLFAEAMRATSADRKTLIERLREENRNAVLPLTSDFLLQEQNHLNVEIISHIEELEKAIALESERKRDSGNPQ